VLALCRLFGGSSLDATLSGQALWPLVGLSAATIVIGNVMALVQTETKRLLAHSGIANSGYLLLGCAALLAHNAAAKPLFTFLCAYAAMTLGAIAILAALEHSHHSIGSLEDLRGLFYRFPLAAAFLSVALLSMIGMPLTAGFWAKLQMFLSAVVTGRAEFFGLGVLMAISSVIGLVYYARLVVMMFERPGANGPVEHHRLERSVPLLCAGACTALTLFWFFAPNAL
jgi:NADH-quinone oxidoreductase subunit N